MATPSNNPKQQHSTTVHLQTQTIIQQTTTQTITICVQHHNKQHCTHNNQTTCMYNQAIIKQHTINNKQHKTEHVKQQSAQQSSPHTQQQTHQWQHTHRKPQQQTTTNTCNK